jgi:hypothetical protein
MQRDADNKAGSALGSLLSCKIALGILLEKSGAGSMGKRRCS